MGRKLPTDEKQCNFEKRTGLPKSVLHLKDKRSIKDADNKY